MRLDKMTQQKTKSDRNGVATYQDLIDGMNAIE